jgi:phage gpG-like protein
LPNEIPQFRLVTYGVREIADDLEALGHRAINTRPIMEEIYLTILDIEEEIFDTQGIRLGGLKWPAITLQWRFAKAKRGADPRILHASGRLRDSVTKYRHPDQHVRIERDKIVFGSKLPYAKIHQTGSDQFFDEGGRVEGGLAISGGLPQRKYIGFSQQDKANFTRGIERHIMKAIRGIGVTRGRVR